MCCEFGIFPVEHLLFSDSVPRSMRRFPYLRLVQAEVLWPSNGCLWGRWEVLPSLAPALNLSIDPLEHPAPAAGAGLGNEGLLGAVHGRDLEGGSGPELAAAADDGALVHAELVQDH